jgi:hypothetical protein
MRNAFTKVLIAAAMTCLVASTGWADLTVYSQDFEGLVQSDPAALGNDGWLYFGNVFDPGGGYIGGYGPGPAPNGGPAFSAIAAGEGGPAQGAQQIVIYSDYNNTNHADGNLVEANVFQEQTIGVADRGTTWEFRFDAKHGDLVAPTTALAFIKVLQPAPSYALVDFITLDTTNLPFTWGTFALNFAVPSDGSRDNHIFQFGFASTATNYDSSGMIYDNINFDLMNPVSVDDSSWGAVKALYR